MRAGNALALLLLNTAAACLIGAEAATWPFASWRRASDAPILSPHGKSWESAGTFNPAVVIGDGKVAMLYRAQDANGTSRLGYAESYDGIHFRRGLQPVLSPEVECNRWFLYYGGGDKYVGVAEALVQ
jgi:beta-1,2-mannosidase